MAGLFGTITSDARNQLGFWSFRAQHDVLPVPFDTVISLDRKTWGGVLTLHADPAAFCGEPLMHVNSFQRRAAPSAKAQREPVLCSTRHRRRLRANFMHYLPITGCGEWVPWYGLNGTCRPLTNRFTHGENMHAEGQDTSKLAKKARAAERRCPGRS